MKSILGFDHLLTPRGAGLFLLDRHAAYFRRRHLLHVHRASDYRIYRYDLFSLIGCRVMFELIMVAFKNNEYLRRIAENTSVKSVE